MGASFLIFLLFTLFWGFVGIGLPIFLPKNENKGIIQTMMVTTAVCCYVMWLCTFLFQLNPLLGPQLSPATQLLVYKNWN